MIRFGYVAQNLTLGETTNRTLRLANLADGDKVRGVTTANLAGLNRILHWNVEHGIDLFRIGQSLIPFASHPEFPYDWREEHSDALRTIGSYAREHGLRLSMHPGQYIQPGSPNPDVVERSLAELRYCADVLAMLDVPDSVIVLHLGGAYGEPDVAAARFIASLAGETEVLRYLALENDEHIWSLQPVLAVADALAIPVIVDTLHLAMNPGGFDLESAFEAARATWKRLGRRQKVHISSQDPGRRRGGHAEGIDPVDWQRLLEVIGDRDTDVMIEAKAKDRALIALDLAGQSTGSTA